MVHQIDPVGGEKAIVERDDDRTGLRDAVRSLEVGVGVGGDVGHPVAGCDPHALQTIGPAVAAVEELGVAPPLLAIDDRFPVTVEGSRSAGEGEWREGRLHRRRARQGAWPFRNNLWCEAAERQTRVMRAPRDPRFKRLILAPRSEAPPYRSGRL